LKSLKASSSGICSLQERFQFPGSAVALLNVLNPFLMNVTMIALTLSNEERGLACETGVWHAYSADDPNEESPVSHGNYAAQWIHQSGEWKIQSQLFVTLN
jgi:hypothetical protein